MESNKRKRFGLMVAGVIALAAGGALVFAHAGGARHFGMGHGAAGIEQMAEHFQVHVKHVLAEVDATPDQQARVNQIISAAATDLEALHSRHTDARAELHALFTAASIDRSRLELLRLQHLAAIDEASRRCVTAMADAAEVLTPEQRASLGAKMAKRHKGFAHGG
jgi:protein CpxP